VSLADQDPSLIQDFLTESGELVDQLDSDLLELEESGGSEDLLNSIFRALHTIKGAASFLDLGNVTSFAHTAEFALDRLRKGEAEVDGHVVDALLRSVDVIKAQLGSIEAGGDPCEAPVALVKDLEAITSGEVVASAMAEAVADGAATDGAGGEAECGPSGALVATLELPDDKAAVMPYMVEDLRESIVGLRGHVERFSAVGADRAAVGVEMAELAASAETTAEFFDLEQLRELINLFIDAGENAAEIAEEFLPDLSVRLMAVLNLMSLAAEALSESRVLSWDVETLSDRCALLGRNQRDDPSVSDHGGDPDRVLEIDGVIRDTAASDVEGRSVVPVAQADVAAGPVIEDDGASSGEADPAGGSGASAPAPAKAAESGAGPAKKQEARSGDTTIRVEVARLESLMNLVGEMTLTKNQVLASTRELATHDVEQDLAERIAAASSDLDRLTSELQQSVMRTRMQPLEKLFGRYPRIVRDLAKKTDKVIELRIEGGDTEVDKSVLELLGDPLVHMLRNSVDHGIEIPGDRVAAGKAETGTLCLRAEHQGGHVRILVEDDGRGIDRQKIGAKAVSRGMLTEEQLASMADEEVYRLIFAPGLSTADEVSDLSGRGVGMDVVNSNIKRLNGMVNVRSTLGGGTTIEIMIPLTVATMAAMVVGVGESEYAVPLNSIEEITRRDGESCSSVRGRPVIRLRDEVIGLIDLRAQLIPGSEGDETGFVVIVGVGQEKAGLVVDRLIGQQEVVIKILNDAYASGGPFSGATIREDGRVNLILDIIKLLRDNSTKPGHASA